MYMPCAHLCVAKRRVARRCIAAAECFKVGVSVTRKSVKLYSSFYHSDLIVASPLGLRLVTGAAEDEKRDIDFLSSIEGAPPHACQVPWCTAHRRVPAHACVASVVVVDQADVLAMQNWEHVVDALQSLNAMPAKVRVYGV